MSSSSEINRLNAQKSTGPKTVEGKKRSSQNAVTHGIFAQDVLVTGEDSEQFRCHKSGMIRRLNPRDVLELHLAEQIVADTWTIQRIRAAEQELYADADQYKPILSLDLLLSDEKPKRKAPKSPGQRLARLMDFDRFERLNRYRQRLSGAVHRCLKELREVRKEKDDPNEPLTDIAAAIVCEMVSDDPQETPIVQNEPISNANDGKKVTCDAAPMTDIHPFNDAPTNKSIAEDEIEHRSDPSSVPRAA